GYRNAAMSRLAYTRRLDRDTTKPEIHRLIDFLRGALSGFVDVDSAIKKEGDVPSLFETEDSAREAGILLQDLQVKAPILVAPSSVWPTKRWTPYGFAELCAKLVEAYGSDVLLVGSKDDGVIAQDVMNFVEETVPPRMAGRIHNVCGKTSLSGLFSLMKRSRMLVSNDSAPVHFGCAAGIPVTAIFGPTVPALGYAPIAPRTIVAEKDLSCRPCGTHGGVRCPLGHFDCMRTLSADNVLEFVRKVS
ncbi:MAG: glycosyltransferase family 9 protein, partial [Spirochaetia bacterium]|nr:glycosyltransferase family 9 protein [Spirochaetia bacterium]